VDLSIVIVNYNTSDCLKNCIDALLDSCKGLEFEIFVVDNASPEGFPESLESYNGHLNIIRNKRNLGFSRANNQALKMCKGEMILLLNPDVEVSTYAITEMMRFLREEEGAGAVGCKTYWDENRRFQFSTLKMPDIKTAFLENTILGRIFPENTYFKRQWDIDHEAWASDVPVPVMGMPAAILMVKRDVLGQIGHFDEGFFLYYEDKDFCKRILDLGYKIYFLPNVEVIHHYGQSTKKEDFESLLRSIKRSRNHYYIKHYGFRGRILQFSISLNDLLVEAAKKVICRLGIGKGEDIAPKEELRLTWARRDDVEKYCLEISVEPHFLHKVGMFLRENEYTLPSSIMSKIPPTNYFWRCIGFKGNGEKVILNYGNFLKR